MKKHKKKLTKKLTKKFKKQKINIGGQHSSSLKNLLQQVEKFSQLNIIH